MRVVQRHLLTSFMLKHLETKNPISSWLKEVEVSKWESPHDIKISYPTASIVGNKKVVFNIKGNHYRLVVNVDYDAKLVTVQWVGKHKDYNQLRIK